ncbi:MAG: response regulator [Deltaproteobacteria bacterium]|nr:response regulator [Deltaproteobacteria bacterium]
MDMLNKISIKNRMMFSFAFTLVLFILFAGFSIIQMNALGELTSTLYEHPLQVSNAALKAKAGVIRMHRGMKDVSMSKTEIELGLAIQAVVNEEKIVYQNLDIVKMQILGKEGKKLVQETIELFAGWKPIRVEVEQLVLQGKKEAANRITRGKGADYVFNLERQMVELTAYAINKADGFMGSAKEVQQRVLRNTVIFVGLVSLLSFLIAYFFIKSITSNVSGLEGTMSEITTTGNLLKAKLTGNNEITEMAQHFNRVIDRLQSQFWLKGGQTQISEELSGDISYNDLPTKSINFISRYVEACTGAFYICDDERSLCELKASYAFVEGEHFSSEFEFGEGIVGQVAIEKKPILLKGITREEAMVNTGTVSEPPKSIYAVPLLYDNKPYGILEVASFEEIASHKIEFLNIAADIVSIALYTATQKKQIVELLELTQRDKEELGAQSEELQSQTQELQQQSEELTEQNVELEAQREQVEEANRLKSEFLSNMSHELRTPLNSVMALSRVLLMQAKDKLSEEELNYLEIIQRNGQNLLSLINNILDLSKIEAGRMDVTPKSFSVTSTIETIMERLEPVAEEKGIHMNQEIPDNLPQIESDEIRVHQILQNLMGNALKFTDQGNVTVSSRSDGKKVHIRVADTGIGISAKDLPHIFQEFRQVDGTSSRSYEGTGLGLAIAHRAAGLLGGELTVQSTLGKGSTFTLILPVKWTGLIPVSVRFAVTEPVNRDLLIGEIHKIDRPAPRRILLVEDNEAAVIQVKTILENDGYVVDVANGGQEALEYMTQAIPNGIILDLMMPRMDGFEVLEKLRSSNTTAMIPVLVLTAKDLTPGDLKKLTANNIQQLIQKGDVDREGLLFRTRLMLGGESAIPLSAVKPTTSTPQPPTRKSKPAETKRVDGTPTILVVEDNPDNMTTIKAILKGAYNILETTDGEEGFNMALSEPPDLILLDMPLPKMAGFTVVRKLKGRKDTMHIPVIALTARAMKGDREKTIQAGCDDYVSKPVDPEKLMETIENHLRK